VRLTLAERDFGYIGRVRPASPTPSTSAAELWWRGLLDLMADTGRRAKVVFKAPASLPPVRRDITIIAPARSRPDHRGAPSPPETAMLEGVFLADLSCPRAVGTERY
jgi:hypothetical protein